MDNINDEKLSLLFSKEVEILYTQNEQMYSMGKIKQPTLQKILDYGGEQKFNLLLLPFCVSKELLMQELKLNGTNTDITKLELLFIGYKSNDLNDIKIQYHQMLLMGLQFFYNSKNIQYLQDDYGFVIDNQYIIDKSNFEVLCEYIRKIVNREEMQLEKKPNFTSDRQRDIYEKLMAGRKRNAEKKTLTLLDIINLIMIKSNNLINYDDFLNKTYLQIMHSYNLTCLKTVDKSAQVIQTVQVLPKDDKMETWLLENIKLINKKQEKEN